MKTLTLVLLVTGLTAVDRPVWHHLPKAVYLEESLALAVDLPEGWSLHGRDRAVLLEGDGAVRTPVRGLRSLTLRDAAGSRADSLVVLRPGEGLPLSLDHGRLHSEGRQVILAVSRKEHREDRRWLILRRDRHGDAPCRRRFSAGEVAVGDSGLLALIAACRGQPVWNQGVVVEVPASDRLVGWKHRSYRQVLAWLAADLKMRGARRIVFVQPPVHRRERAEVAPLRERVRDVARTYGAEVVEVPGLSEDRYWTLAGDLLGDRLNRAGRTALDRLVAPYLEQP